MSKDVIVYEVDCLGIPEYHNALKEMEFDAIYQAGPQDDAIEAAALFLRNRCDTFKLRPGCLKVGYFYINHISPTGKKLTHRGLPFFEWKFDTSPHSLEDLIHSSEIRKQGGS